MSETMTYQLIPRPPGTPPGDAVILRSDGAHIPSDPANRDYQAYVAWIEAGNVPETVPPLAASSLPPEPGEPTPTEAEPDALRVLAEAVADLHERVTALEGEEFEHDGDASRDLEEPEE